MKLGIIILWIVCIVGIVFTTLYFTNPRVVIDEMGIPATIHMASKPEPPDTIYLADNTISDSLRNVILQLRSDIFQLSMSIDTSNTYPQNPDQRIYISSKQFAMSDLLADVTSDVTMYGASPVDLVENSITIVPNQEELLRRVGVATDSAHKKGMKTGLLVGIGGVAAIILAVTIIAN